MVFTYRKHPFTQGDTEEKSDAKLSRDELASAFSLQASSIRIKRPDGVAAVIENAQDDIIYTVHGSSAAQTTTAGPLWGSTGRVTLGSLPSSFLEFLLDLQWLLSSSAHQTGMPCKQFGTLSKNSLLSTFSEDLKSAELHKKIQDQASRLRRSSSSGSV
ncbi:hypothetical protein PROFUN_01533 [Planoprotostelium fungivorum]|uniref:Uncharacterized protein n=1 Tax=Planoprotostelium fungivorum TaxID=1890364 RepID=A0A2P6NTK2_9EUKA|nr:hypothetical protein PROFUN_01533 [Planoprotostelium fungivorum]